MSEFVARISALALALGGPGLFLVAFLDSSFLPLPGITEHLDAQKRHQDREPVHQHNGHTTHQADD